MATATKKKHSAKSDRAFKRSNERKIKARKEQAVDVDTGQKYEMEILDGDSSQMRRRAPVVKEGLKLIKVKSEVELIEDNTKKRVRYAAMHAHREIAAAVLALGGTRKQASRKAGVSTRQIQKYYSDPDFRERIQELQELAGNKIRGRVMKEVSRRTDPVLIKKIDLLDLLRIGDRFGLGRGNASAINISQTEINNYEAIFNDVFLGDDPEQLTDGEAESEDFPTFEPSRLALSGGDSPVDS